MRWPFVSLAMHEEVIRESTARANAEHENAMALRRALADMTEKYHALREKGYSAVDPASFPLVAAPLTLLGEKTKAALRDMSIGLPAANRRAMEAKALAYQANDMSDEQVAALVRRGEPIRPMPD